MIAQIKGIRLHGLRGCRNFYAAVIIALLISAVVSAEVVKKEPTKNEMLALLKKEVAGNDDIFGMIPELRSGKDQNGNIFYTFKGIKLDDLTKEEIDKLAVRVRQALVKIRSDRIERQLENVRQLQRLQRLSAPPQPPKAPSSLPPASASPPPAPPGSSRR